MNKDIEKALDYAECLQKEVEKLIIKKWRFILCHSFIGLILFGAHFIPQTKEYFIFLFIGLMIGCVCSLFIFSVIDNRIERNKMLIKNLTKKSMK